jgi:hypothetical protein
VAGEVLADLAPAWDRERGTAGGAPGRAGKNGAPGEDGEDGAAGEPGEPGGKGGDAVDGGNGGNGGAGGAAVDMPTENAPATPVREPVDGSWSGLLMVLPGQEERTYLQASLFTNAEAFLYGELVPLASVPRELLRPKRPAAAPPVVQKAEDPPPPELSRPRVVLQARTGARGGNPNRIDMLGKKNAYVERIEAQPLDLTTPPLMRDPSLVYCEGGRLPTGQSFVITRATWSGTTKGDSNGPGELRLVIAGKEIALEEEGEEPVLGAWNGRLVVRPGEEPETYVEIRNSSTADVLLTGYFEPLAH